MSTIKDNSTVETAAMKLFGGKDLLLERPPDMTQEEYKMARYLQNSTIKKLFRHKPSRRIANLMR